MFSAWRMRFDAKPLSCLVIDLRFQPVLLPFSALNFGLFYCFRVFSRLFLNSAKQGEQFRQERQEHLVHTTVLKASLPSLSKFNLTFRLLASEFIAGAGLNFVQRINV